MNVYGYNIEYKDKMDLIKKILNVYATITNIDKGKNYLRPKLVDVLSFYILQGYSKKTKELVLESLDITTKNLNQINSELTKKKYLIRDLNNFTKKHLSEDIKTLKNYFLSKNSAKVFVLKLKNSE